MRGVLTVTTPAASASLTTLEAARDEVGDGGGSDASLARLIVRASALVASHCGRTFGVETVAEVFRPAQACAASPLILGRAPIRAVAGVTAAGEALAAPLWECEAGAGLLHRLAAAGSHRAPWGRGPVTVLYSTGWTLPGDPARDLPADVEAACLALIAAAWHARGRDPGVVSEGLNGASVRYREGAGAGVPAEVAEMLAPYRAVCG